MPPLNILSLPCDVLYKIASYLVKEDIQVLSETCTAMHKLMTDELMFFRKYKENNCTVREFREDLSYRAWYRHSHFVTYRPSLSRCQFPLNGPLRIVTAFEESIVLYCEQKSQLLVLPYAKIIDVSNGVANDGFLPYAIRMNKYRLGYVKAKRQKGGSGDGFKQQFVVLDIKSGKIEREVSLPVDEEGLTNKYTKGAMRNGKAVFPGGESENHVVYFVRNGAGVRAVNIETGLVREWDTIGGFRSLVRRPWEIGEGFVVAGVVLKGESRVAELKVREVKGVLNVICSHTIHKVMNIEGGTLEIIFVKQDEEFIDIVCCVDKTRKVMRVSQTPYSIILRWTNQNSMDLNGAEWFQWAGIEASRKDPLRIASEHMRISVDGKRVWVLFGTNRYPLNGLVIVSESCIFDLFHFHADSLFPVRTARLIREHPSKKFNWGNVAATDGDYLVLGGRKEGKISCHSMADVNVGQVFWVLDVGVPLEDIEMIWNRSIVATSKTSQEVFIWRFDR